MNDTPTEVHASATTGTGDVLPSDALEGALELSARFPRAGLRPVALVRAKELDARADPTGCRSVWLAIESLQVTGSFKVRGALCAMAAALKAGRRRVVTASAGNHGAGVAHAAQVLDMEASIVVPENTPQRKLKAMHKPGVSIVRIPGGYDHAQAHAVQLARAQGLPFVSPYDDPLVAAGNGASLGFEMVSALGRVPERVVAPIGGGGLATGLACALASESGQDPCHRTRVWTAQSDVSPAFALSMKSGAAVEELEPRGPTLAEGLEGGISRSSFARAARVVAGVSIVTERHIAEAMNYLWQTLGVRVEGSAAAALVPVLRGRTGPDFEGDLVVVLTGRNVDEAVFRRVVDEAGPC